MNSNCSVSSGPDIHPFLCPLIQCFPSTFYRPGTVPTVGYIYTEAPKGIYNLKGETRTDQVNEPVVTGCEKRYGRREQGSRSGDVSKDPGSGKAFSGRGPWAEIYRKVGGRVIGQSQQTTWVYGNPVPPVSAQAPCGARVTRLPSPSSSGGVGAPLGSGLLRGP